MQPQQYNIKIFDLLLMISNWNFAHLWLPKLIQTRQKESRKLQLHETLLPLLSPPHLKIRSKLIFFLLSQQILSQLVKDVQVEPPCQVGMVVHLGLLVKYVGLFIHFFKKYFYFIVLQKYYNGKSSKIKFTNLEMTLMNILIQRLTNILIMT